MEITNAQYTYDTTFTGFKEVIFNSIRFRNSKWIPLSLTKFIFKDMMPDYAVQFINCEIFDDGLTYHVFEMYDVSSLIV